MLSVPAKATNSRDMKSDDFKRIIALLRREIMVKDERLKGVEDLTKICHELEEKRDSWQTKAVNYETALRRAEARIAYLSKKLGIGPQSAFNIDVVNPGISRKDFEALTKENIRLKEALDHIVDAELGGQDVVMKNRELYELVTTLQEDLSRCEHHIKELEDTLKSRGDDLATKVTELTKLKFKYERSIMAKQVFSENLLKENKKLKYLLEKHDIVEVVNLQTLDVSVDLPDGHVRNNVQRVNKDKTVSVRSDVPNEEQERLKAAIAENEKIISELATKNEEMGEEIAKLNKQIAELTSELEKANVVVKKAEAELNETTKKCTDFQKKCAGFFKQVVSLNEKQQKSESEISTLKRTNDNLLADVEEKKAMLTMMTDSLKNYEEDFRRENEDKANFEKKLRTAQQESERLKRENQSHMATIRHFETEIERMNKLLNDERSRKNTSGFSAFSQALGTTTSRSIFQDRGPSGIVVADGGGVNEADNTRQRNQYSTSNTKSEPPKSSAPTLIECPYCSRSYPYHLIEGHVQDCMEDSLYMDD